jgi:hypothetical protein
MNNISDPQMGEYNFTNPEGHALANVQIPSFEKRPRPVEDRPIKLIYNNLHPYEFAKVEIFGQELNPADYEINAHTGLVTLKYHWHQVEVEVSNETP